MKKNGYFGIGIERGKTEFNWGSLFRTAQIFNADFLFTIGKKYKSHRADVMKSHRHIPTFNYKDFDDFAAHRPYNCKLIGIELSDKATKLSAFKHPKKAIYLLGAEDNGLSRKAQESCNDLIILPGEHSLNVAVAGSIVIYDRITKADK